MEYTACRTLHLPGCYYSKATPTCSAFLLSDCLQQRSLATSTRLQQDEYSSVHELACSTL